jgi:hypothetical protein
MGRMKPIAIAKRSVALDRVRRDAANFASFSTAGPLEMEDCGNCRSDVDRCRTDAHRHTVEKKLQGQDCNPSKAYDMVV